MAMDGFRPMRRCRQQIPTDECERILSNATSGVLALIGDGGYPYAVPLSHVYKDGSLYFHSAVVGHKIDALRNNPKCSYCVVDKDEVHPETFTTYYRSVVAFGTVSVIEDREEKLCALRLLGKRFNPDDEAALQAEISHGFDRLLMLRMQIEHMSGKQAKELLQ